MHSQSYLLAFLSGMTASFSLVFPATAETPWGSPRQTRPEMATPSLDIEITEIEAMREDSPAALNPEVTEIEMPEIEGDLSAEDRSPTLDLSVYRADLFCETLVPESQTVPRTRATEIAIGSILKDWAQGEFSIAGYRTRRDDRTQTVTVDLRLAPDARRPWVSLSTCEQFALFGSLRTTLLQNPELETQVVEFTSQGQLLQF